MNVNPLLTDFYQFTMAYALWKANKVEEVCTFELFFRKNPFHGEFTVFGGLEDALKFIQTFSYNENDIDFLRKKMPEYIEQEFFHYLKNITTYDLTVYAISEGTVVFPKVPLMIITGPIIIVQLLETTLLNLINFASLMTTNAARHRLVAGQNLKLMEFGLRRAQGPNGALSASKYAYMGGFDSTSNVLAGQLFNIPICGTHAHSFIMSFSSATDVNQSYELPYANDKTKTCDLSTLTYHFAKLLRNKINFRSSESSESELKAMMSYAVAYPHSFFALVDTYDVLRSGLPNFAAVSIALHTLGYKPLGIRIDSGDLAYLSREAKEFFKKVDEVFEIDCFTNLQIMASNDITEEIIRSLAEQNHEITAFGIGTNLVTCFKQPALGCVYKLVELNGESKMKLTQDCSKLTIPGKKFAYRLMGSKNEALVDLMLDVSETPPVPGVKVLCQHPFKAAKRVYVTPKDVIPLHQLYFEKGQIVSKLPTLQQIREFIKDNLEIIRPDIKRYLNPTPYKVSVSSQLYDYMHTLWLKNTPIDELN